MSYLILEHVRTVSIWIIFSTQGIFDKVEEIIWPILLENYYRKWTTQLLLFHVEKMMWYYHLTIKGDVHNTYKYNYPTFPELEDLFPKAYQEFDFILYHW